MNGHFVVDDLRFACLMIAEFFVQIAVPALLQDRIELPVRRAVEPLGFHDRLLRIALAPVFGHNENRRNALARFAVFAVDHPYHADLLIVRHDEIIRRFRLIETPNDLVDFLRRGAGFGVVILFIQLRKRFDLHFPNRLQIVNDARHIQPHHRRNAGKRGE